jgi:hypothetical protein
MEEGFEKKEDLEKKEEPEKTDGTDTNVREEIFSKAVRAGKRTYFFDVKATRRNDYYLTITESKKRFNRDGRFYYEKHKIFLYKEDFDKFSEGLKEVVEYIKENRPEMIEKEEITAKKEEPETKADVKVDEELAETYTDVDFEDLDDKK